jgi:hypothetical protein
MQDLERLQCKMGDRINKATSSQGIVKEWKNGELRAQQEMKIADH